ncbi:MAG TPA: hypothetical protein VMJ70_05375 [Candidatus Sulfotelmatobacter sp.]|nr:hypothetical protein [Candidatus Sulfotelmatobacter sp.]
MVEISVEDDKVVFEVQGWDRHWGLTSRLRIPIEHIKGASRENLPGMGWLNGIKMWGTSIPNLFRAGCFFQDGEFIYWDVRNLDHAIAVSLEHERYKKLIIEVLDPDTAIAAIEAALSTRRP